MNISHLKIAAFFFLLLTGVPAVAQTDNYEDKNVSVNISGVKGFHVGFYAGALFPSNYSASLYDGYGIDATSGTKNNFLNSVMVQRMILSGMDSVNCPQLHGGGPGYQDVIGPAIGVTSHDQWSFDSTDMPITLKYTTAFLFGLQLQYGINRSEGLILNANFAKINVTGTFTMTVHNNLVNPTLGDSVLYFGITGQEQRFNLQLGYSRVLGDPDDMFNFVVEGGLLFNSTKWLNNYANIGTLKLDLTPFTYNSGYTNNYLPSQYNSTGYGAFAGIGGNLCTTKYIIQLLYSPSYERIGIGEAPTAKLQNAIGLRFYYGL